MKLSPFQVFNQYSFVVSVVFLAVFGSAFLWVRSAGLIWWIGFLIVLAAIVGYMWVSRIQQPQPVVVKLNSVEDIRNTLRKSGKPSLVEFYSNY